MSGVDLPRLAEALADFDQAFLITVGDGPAPHTVAVEPALVDGVFETGEVGGRTSANVDRHPDVTLLWPPRETGGYALLVDGTAEPGGDGRLRIIPAKALLHRRAVPGSAAAESGCLHDCVVFKAS
ncbi:pyridoxamine 5'-phosphate oxidase family protein [Mycolicibacterium thermoresistibile]